MKTFLFIALQILLVFAGLKVQPYLVDSLSFTILVFTALPILLSVLGDRVQYGKTILRYRILIASILSVHVGIFAGLYGASFAILEVVSLILVSRVFELKELPFYLLAKLIPGNSKLGNLKQNPKHYYFVKLILLCMFVCEVGFIAPVRILSMDMCEYKHDGFVGKPDPAEVRKCSYKDMSTYPEDYVPVMLIVGFVFAMVGGLLSIAIQKRLKMPAIILFVLFSLPIIFFAVMSLQHDMMLASVGFLAALTFLILRKDLDGAIGIQV